MKIDLEEYRIKLKQIEGDTLAALERAENEARGTASAEVQDPVDVATTDQEKDLSLDSSNRNYETLVQVREALERIEAGTYGKCVICGREIPKARLDAIPWTPYCVQDAEALEPKFTPSTL